MRSLQKVLPLRLPEGGLEPRLEEAIRALELPPHLDRTLRALARRDQGPAELATALGLAERTAIAHLQELDRRGVAGPAWGVTWGLRASWVRDLGIGDGRPACVPV